MALLHLAYNAFRLHFPWVVDRPRHFHLDRDVLYLYFNQTDTVLTQNYKKKNQLSIVPYLSGVELEAHFDYSALDGEVVERMVYSWSLGYAVALEGNDQVAVVVEVRRAVVPNCLSLKSEKKVQ